MRWIVPALTAALLAAACGGPKIPAHSGYKSEKAEPWKKAKVLSWNDKNEAKAEDDLNYGEYRRAKWYAVDLLSGGSLAMRLDVTPPGEGTNEDFDLAVEILDPGYRVLAKSDQEDDDAGETTKSKSLAGLPPGRYYVHLYLEGRLDFCDYVLRLTSVPAAALQAKTDFPAQVRYLDPLPVVPPNDDAPKDYKKPAVATSTTTTKPHTGKNPPKPPPVVVAPVVNLSGRIVGVAVNGGSTTITIAKGTDGGAKDGMHAHVKGISSAGELTGCGPRSCKASIDATPDQIKAAGSTVTITP